MIKLVHRTQTTQSGISVFTVNERLDEVLQYASNWFTLFTSVAVVIDVFIPPFYCL